MRDISFEGACIDTGLSAVPPSTEIDLIFTQQDDATAEVIRIGAYGVRGDDRGIGVSFHHCHDGSRKYLLKLLG